MPGKVRRTRGGVEFLHETGLADAGIAAHQKAMALAKQGRTIQQPGKLAQLMVPADKCCRAVDRRFAERPLDGPDLQ